MSIAEILDKAADLIVENGWTRGAWQDDETGCLCAEGALGKAGAASRFIDVVISSAGKFFADFIGSHITDWNDAPNRTQSEVVSKLREAADLAREKGL